MGAAGGHYPDGSPWSDLHDLGVTALVLLGGTAGEGGCWPKGLELEALGPGSGALAFGGTGAPFSITRHRCFDFFLGLLFLFGSSLVV